MIYDVGSEDIYVGLSPWADEAEIEVVTGENSGWDAYSRKDSNNVSTTFFKSSLKFVSPSSEWASGTPTSQYDYLTSTDGMVITGAAKVTSDTSCMRVLAKSVSYSDCTINGSGDSDDKDKSDDSDDGGITVLAILLIIVLALGLVALLIFLCMRRNKKQQDQKSIIYGGPAIENEDTPMMDSATDLGHD